MSPEGAFASFFWYDDHLWWIALIEFQPSAWAKGSYLNVGVMWLWNAKEYWSFDEGYRVGNFDEFHTEEQFYEVALALVNRAAYEVVSLREKFSSAAAVADFMLGKTKTSLWEHYHAAMAFAHAGDYIAENAEFSIVQKDTHDVPWVLEVKEKASELAKLLESPETFRQAASKEVNTTRALLYLPAIGPSQSNPGPSS